MENFWQRNAGMLAFLIAAFAMLMAGTIMVFLAFDRHSHSASDTLRPFVITMFPVWLIALGGARVLLRQH